MLRNTFGPTDGGRILSTVSTEATSPFELSVARGDCSFRAVGSLEAVNEAYAKFEELLGEAPSRPAPANGHERQNGTTKTNGSGKRSLQQLVKEQGFQRNPQIAAAIVTWAHDHDGRKSLTAPETKKLWKATPIKPPGNVNRDLDSAVKQGWLDKDGRDYAPNEYGRAELGLA
jgi:hypothetical protein